jgi:hypothetical protein
LKAILVSRPLIARPRRRHRRRRLLAQRSPRLFRFTRFGATRVNRSTSIARDQPNSGR